MVAKVHYTQSELPFHISFLWQRQKQPKKKLMYTKFMICQDTPINSARNKHKFGIFQHLIKNRFGPAGRDYINENKINQISELTSLASTCTFQSNKIKLTLMCIV
jgi:hypothetical protein